jgi:hypothetical protein
MSITQAYPFSKLTAITHPIEYPRFLVRPRLLTLT